uniref:Uncharacterized protein n=1 Tax=Xenopus tropicalis TaxID=8364 RepID=A0A1B8Y938_XENTR
MSLLHCYLFSYQRQRPKSALNLGLTLLLSDVWGLPDGHDTTLARLEAPSSLLMAGGYTTGEKGRSQ